MIQLSICKESANAQIWPTLADLAMSPQDVAARRTGIGGSDANVILSGNGEAITSLWQVKRGVADEANLSRVLPVMLGMWTEPFNRFWYERQTGLAVSDAGLVAIAEDHAWRRATLDGIVTEKASVWEAKHTSAFSKPDEILARYMPQLQHNMAVTGLENAVLSVIYGNHRFEIYEIAADWLYQDALLAAEANFWACVQSGCSPVAQEPPPAPRPIASRELSFEGHNAWAIAAWDWLDTAEAVRRHGAATGAIKGLLEDDVSRAFGHGIEARRSKSGAVTIRAIAA